MYKNMQCKEQLSLSELYTLLNNILAVMVLVKNTIHIAFEFIDILSL